MDSLKFETEEDLNKYLINKYPGINTNLLRYEIYLKAMGTSLGEVMKKMEVSGSPFLKLSDR